ncbi:MAG: glycosyltransferase family 4 protein [Desulfarculus sp.]|nr:glycosyltransferase family 4 protein [Desulfarculus sp.]
MSGLILDARPLQPGFKAHAQRGIGRYAKNLLRAMLELVDPGRVTFLVQANLPDPELPAAIPRRRLPFLPGVFPVGKKLVSYHLLAPLWLLAGWRGGRVTHFLCHLDAPSRPGPRTVLTVHDLIAQKMAALYRGKRSGARFGLERWLETRCLFAAAGLIAVSECTRRDLAELYGLAPEAIRVIPEAADPGLAPVDDPAARAAVLARWGLEAGRFFLYLGGIDQRKGLTVLLEALAALAQAGRPHSLALVGRIADDRQYPLLRAEIVRLGLTDRVRELGYVPDADLPALFGACAAFVFPSLYEGFGLPPLEAMACGAPVVAARAGAVPEVVGSAGLLVEPGDAQGLGQALMELTARPELAADLRARGLRQAAGFSWRRTATETLAVYREAGYVD